MEKADINSYIHNYILRFYYVKSGGAESWKKKKVPSPKRTYNSGRGELPEKVVFVLRSEGYISQILAGR